VKKNKSLETKLIISFATWLTLPLIPCAFLIYYKNFDVLESFTLLLIFILPGIWLFYRSFKNIINVIDRIGLQLDSLGNDEYNTWHLAGFQGGRIESLKSDFTKLGKRLAGKRKEYLQNESFVFEFIKELDLPIVVLDHHFQIYLTNQSFEQQLRKGINCFNGMKVKELGLELVDEQWKLTQSVQFKQRFEVNEHILMRGQRSYRLLVLFSIENQLRVNEKQVWQKLIRVLNHEVRNSLTPIYSMSQSLQEMKLMGELTPSQQKLETNMLQVIENRAKQLLEFVDSYSTFNQLTPAAKLLVNSEEIIQRMQVIFPELKIVIDTNIRFNADAGQLEQALINLIKNAFEASNNITDKAEVIMTWLFNQNQLSITISDNGSGISNLENLFVPFYSTKGSGTGIGLVMSRELIRNQNGDLTLVNRTNGQGAIAKITLPL